MSDYSTKNFDQKQKMKILKIENCLTVFLLQAAQDFDREVIKEHKKVLKNEDIHNFNLKLSKMRIRKQAIFMKKWRK